MMKRVKYENPSHPMAYARTHARTHAHTHTHTHNSEAHLLISARGEVTLRANQHHCKHRPTETEMQLLSVR